MKKKKVLKRKKNKILAIVLVVLIIIFLVSLEVATDHGIKGWSSKQTSAVKSQVEEKNEYVKSLLGVGCVPNDFQCGDCIDNDGDGLIDYEVTKKEGIIGDLDCHSFTDNSESSENCVSSCTKEPSCLTSSHEEKLYCEEMSRQVKPIKSIVFDYDYREPSLVNYGGQHVGITINGVTIGYFSIPTGRLKLDKKSMKEAGIKFWLFDDYGGFPKEKQEISFVTNEDVVVGLLNNGKDLKDK